MLPNLKRDKHFLKLLKSGSIKVSTKGRITNILTGKRVKNKINCGYKRTCIKGISIATHRLVWLAHQGKIPYRITINHKDGNKIHNDINNLELATYSENQKHAIKTGLWKPTKKFRRVSSEKITGEKNHNSKFSDIQVKGLRKKYAKGKINKQYIMDKYGVSRRVVDNMLLGRSYSHMPFTLSKVRRGNA